ncbi:hypothetical protein [Lapillicoccus jejuensis]|uniref:Uncharacterized protein n=1 Tax=Lapillicoccus jejuensis TaxID=402171 RepID=A0A542DVI4_9MICO|nr:hypothetical protein [Lapillicoccus jejuensis]TQJ07088.1 hypothetical protein FB458_0135 [Lapillicoccus jejuensis]
MSRRVLRVRGWTGVLGWSALAYVATVVVLTLLDVQVSLVLLAGVVGALVSVVVWVDHGGFTTTDPTWPTATVSTRGLGRGSDHRTAARGQRLAGAPGAAPDVRAHLAAELRADLLPAIASRSLRVHGLDATSDPRLLALLPPTLADVVALPADERLLDPAHLDRVLADLDALTPERAHPPTRPDRPTEQP